MDHHAHVPSIVELLWPVANFLVFAVFLVRQLGGPLREFFRTRAQRLRDELAAGDRARRDAEALRASLAKDLADLPALRDRLKTDLREVAERERDQMLAQGRQTAARIRNDARLLADQEVAAARRALRDAVVEEALREATKIVSDSVGPADQERFVAEFLGGAGSAS